MPAIPTLAQRIGEDSISKFEAGAARRFEEGVLLLEGKKLLAGIYLLGYVAEMRMKAARFRILGYHIHDELTMEVRKKAKDDASGVPLSNHPHDLEDEAALLVFTRKKRTAGYSNPLRNEIMFHATALNARWRPALRYRAIIPLPAESNVVREAAEWFEENYARLWS